MERGARDLLTFNSYITGNLHFDEGSLKFKDAKLSRIFFTPSGAGG